MLVLAALKIPLILLTIALLSGCATGDPSARSGARETPIGSGGDLIQEHAEALQRANPDLDESHAYKIARRRFESNDSRYTDAQKRNADQEAFEQDLERVMGKP